MNNLIKSDKLTVTAAASCVQGEAEHLLNSLRVLNKYKTTIKKVVVR